MRPVHGLARTALTGCLLVLLAPALSAHDMFRYGRACDWLASAENEMHVVDGLDIGGGTLKERIAHLDQRMRSVERVRGIEPQPVDATLGIGDRKEGEVYINLLIPGVEKAAQIFESRLDAIYGSHAPADSPAPAVRAPSSAEARGLRCQVVTVERGDSVQLRFGRVLLYVRLMGVDAPRPPHPSSEGEAHGDAARRALRKLLEGGEVILVRDPTVRPARRSPRAHAYLHRVEDGLCVNEEMIRQGHARVRRGEVHRELKTYRELEAKAREARAGVWLVGDVNPFVVPPDEAKNSD